MKLKVTLTNGQESPQFCAVDAGYTDSPTHKMAFDSNTIYRKYEFAIYPNTKPINGVRFYDENRSQTLSYNQPGWDHWKGQQQIPEG